MGRLTEDLIYAKTKISNIQRVRKLNCWGCQIDDISLLHEMIGVEVLSLSRNDICTLSPISGCVSLEELYLRENKIAEIDEIFSLQNLPNLRILWLADNPVAETPEYRKKVLRILPNLQRLDDINVTKEELNSCHSPEVKPEDPEPVEQLVQIQPAEWTPPANQQISPIYDSSYEGNYSPASVENPIPQGIQQRSSLGYCSYEAEYHSESDTNCCNEGDVYLENCGTEGQEDDYEEIYEQPKQTSPPSCVSHKSVETDWPQQQSEEIQRRQQQRHQQPLQNVRMSQSAYVFSHSRSQTPTRQNAHSVPPAMRQQGNSGGNPQRFRVVNDHPAEFRPVRNNNVLAAILTLLNELDPTGLKVVIDEAQARLSRH